MVGKQNDSKRLAEVNSSQPVRVDTKIVLSCHPIPTSVLVTWEIILRDKPLCTKAYRSDNNVTKEVNCTDKRITWAFRPDQNSSLLIDPVAITHDGYYRCLKATPDGNFHRGYNLQVLVAPEVTLFRSNNGTAVCKAVAGKPAARISWIPEGYCVPKQEIWGNGTVTVWSTCHWADSNVSTVSCSVSHPTGIRNLTIELSQGAPKSDGISMPHVILFIFIILIMLAIVGSIWLLKISGCRKCKLKKIEGTPVEEDEMQPYASYTEKKNPLYDTLKTVKTSQVLQSEVDGTDLHTF
ncbi:cell surface glycoprotein CD200 receptor 1 [Rhinolophus ferrumequinum]|nr:cell surface glycoprotein CD200 receptor 1 [Rhinolophus ferrumequinum]